jgi:anti-sigma28 factor (negative regulator of flagellin synthesis)
MSASEILNGKGITLRVIGDELSLSPKEKVTPDVLAFAKAHKKQIMAELQGVIWRNPHPEGTPEARRESMMQVINATWQDVYKRVSDAYEEKQTQFKATKHIRMLERRIETLQQAILNGEAKLSDFSIAAHEWQRAAQAELN